MPHQHTHEHQDGHSHDHSHAITSDSDQRYVVLALCLIAAFMVGEVIAGFIAGSLALLSDAGHMLTDAGALVLALVTMRLSKAPPKGIMTYGLKRSEILSAQINGTSLVALAVVFVVEGIQHLVHPPVVQGKLVLILGLTGIGANLLATIALGRANRESLNIRGSFRHIVTDLVAFIATSIAGAIMYAVGGLYRLDAVAAFVVAGIMANAGVGIVRDAYRILLEAAPKGMDPEEIRNVMLNEASVEGIEDFHVWEITSGFPALSAHILVSGGIDCHAKRRDLSNILAKRFSIEHTTLQVDHIG